jgi:prophage antirepressor-like protein
MTTAVRPLGPDEVVKLDRIKVGMLRGGRPIPCFSESGLYKLVLRSDKPQAKKFQDWVTRDVLPAIRKDGRHGAGARRRSRPARFRVRR